MSEKRMWTQSQHEEFNRTHYPGTREMCCRCDEPTGNAGRGDGSIYRELLKSHGRQKAGV